MRIVVGIIVGAVIGFLIGSLGRCSTGVCTLTKNPWISMVVGALFGFMIAKGT